jgi:hypothetical protein
VLPGHRKKRLRRIRLSADSSRRMAMWTHNLPSVPLRKRLWWSRWSDIPRCWKSIWTYFLHPGNKKNDLDEFAKWWFK